MKGGNAVWGKCMDCRVGSGKQDLLVGCDESVCITCLRYRCRRSRVLMWSVAVALIDQYLVLDGQSKQ
jgi:hypothetical protein